MQARYIGKNSWFVSDQNDIERDFFDRHVGHITIIDGHIYVSVTVYGDTIYDKKLPEVYDSITLIGDCLKLIEDYWRNK